MHTEQQRFLQAIRDSEVIHAPFPHASIDGGLSEAFLQTLYAHLPAPQEFNDEGYGLKTFQIWDESEELLNWRPAERRFWQDCNAALFSEEVAEAIHTLFRPAMENLYRDLFSDPESQLAKVELQPWSTSGALNIRAPGNCLPTHMDWPNRLYSLILYLDPDQHFQEDWGTRLFHGPKICGPQGVEVMAKRARDHVRDCTAEASTLVPFKPGRVTIFMNTPWSYHGANVAANAAGSRWCLVKGINMTLAATEQLFGLPPELR